MIVPAYSFVSALKFALSAAGRTDVRYYLNGVSLAGDRVAATDGHRVAYVLTEWAFPEPVVLQRAGVEQLLKVLKPKRGSIDEIELTFAADHVVVSMAGLSVQVPLIADAAHVPDMVSRVFPSWIDDAHDGAPVMGFDAKLLAEAFKACAEIANTKYRDTRIHTRDATTVVVLEPGIVAADHPGIKRALFATMPQRQ